MNVIRNDLQLRHPISIKRQRNNVFDQTDSFCISYYATLIKYINI